MRWYLAPFGTTLNGSGSLLQCTEKLKPVKLKIVVSSVPIHLRRGIKKIRSRLIGFLSGFNSDSSLRALPNSFIEGAIWSHFSVKKEGARAILKNHNI
jgi:hypothetical protein